jgi:hypothetical protein
MMNLKFGFNVRVYLYHSKQLEILYIFRQFHDVKTLVNTFISFVKDGEDFVLNTIETTEELVPLVDKV